MGVLDYTFSKRSSRRSYSLSQWEKDAKAAENRNYGRVEMPTGLKIKAEDFHPMRGHVGEGNEVIFDDGRVWVIRDGGTGWNLREKDYTYVAGPFDAQGLTVYIVNSL